MACKINEQVPGLKPWVGAHFREAEERLLVVGESHYLPAESEVHHDAEAWYQASQEDLTETEQEWISTRDIIRYALDSSYAIKSHWIFKNIGEALNDIAGFDDPRACWDYIAFTNYFKRPALEGDSIQPTSLDQRVAAECLEDLLVELKPTIVVFASSLAGKYGEEVVDKTPAPYHTVPHPTSQWWNREAAKYYGKTGRQLFIEFLTECKWSAT